MAATIDRKSHNSKNLIRFSLVNDATKTDFPISDLASIFLPGMSINAPSLLVATAISTTEINLTWQDNSNNETGFTIERDTDVAFSSPIEILKPAGAVSHSDTGLSSDTLYYYRVKATVFSNSSDWSNTANDTTFYDLLNGIGGDGSDDFIALSTMNSVSLPGGAFGGSIWFRLGNTFETKESGEFDTIWRSSSGAAQQNRISIDIVYATTTFTIEVQMYDASSVVVGNASVILTRASFSVDDVIHVVWSIVENPSVGKPNATISVNGGTLLTGSGVVKTFPATFGNNNKIGANHSTPFYHHSHTIGGFILFSGIELTLQSQVEDFYNSGNGSNPNTAVSNLGGSVIAWWKFNEGSGTTANDSGGNSYDGTLTNFADTAGKNKLYYSNKSGAFTVGKTITGGTSGATGTIVSVDDIVGLKFDGLKNVVDFGGANVLAATGSAWSVGGWFNLNSFINSFPAMFGLKSGVANNPFAMQYSNNASYSDLTFGSVGTFFRGKVAVGTLLDTYVHIIITYNGGGAGTSGNYKVYVNGSSKTITASGAYGNSTDESNLGVKGGNEFPFDGSIDRFAFWQSELTSGQVTNQYNSGAGADADIDVTPLVWFKLNDMADNLTPNSGSGGATYDGSMIEFGSYGSFLTLTPIAGNYEADEVITESDTAETADVEMSVFNGWGIF